MKSKPILVIIDDLPALDELEAYLKDQEYVAYDIETTGVHKGAEILGISICCEEDKAYYVMHQGWSPEKQQLVRTGVPKPMLVHIVELLKDKKLVCHNGVFDCAKTESYLKVSLIESLHTDTMILAHLLDENRRVGLKELASTMFGADSTAEQQAMKDSVYANGGLLTKDKYEMYKADPRLMAEYGAMDAILTYKLFLALVPQLFEQGLDKFFYEDESMPLLRGATYQMNTVGVKVNQVRLADLKRQLEIECIEAKAFIYQEIDSHVKEKYPATNKKNSFNIGSNVQMSWLLFGKLGLEFSTLTNAGRMLCRQLGMKVPYTAVTKRQFIKDIQDMKDQTTQPEAIVNGKKIRAKQVKDPWNYIACDKNALAKHAKAYKWISVLLEHQRKTKLLNTYVEGISSRLEYGILQGSFLQHGTTSGRYASRNPNMQNMPRDDKRIKECFVSRPGKSFVGADFSQLEVRVFASVSGDEALLESFKSGEDFYSVIGMEVFGKHDCTPFKEGSDQAFGVKYKELRKAAKELALASTYGASAWQLRSKLNKPEQEVQKDIDSYFENFPKVAKMMLTSHEMAKSDGQVTSIYGRPRRLPNAKKINKIYGDVPHGELPYEARSILNLAVNHRIQGTAASVCNRGMIKFVNDIKDMGIQDCYIISQIHDEIIAECRDEDVETVAVLLENAMCTGVTLPGVDLEAIPTISKNIAGLK